MSRVAPPEEISIIVNTGDDIEMFALHRARPGHRHLHAGRGCQPGNRLGTGYDTFNCLEQLLGYTQTERWFNLGDRDLAAHIFRAQQLRQGRPLSEIAERLRTALGVKSRILPMTDTHTPTTIIPPKARCIFRNTWSNAAPNLRSPASVSKTSNRETAPGIAEAVLRSDAIIICPSNPLISIGPIPAGQR